MNKEDWDRGRRHRVVAVALALLLFGAAGRLVAAARSASGAPARAASVVPDGLFSDLVGLDRKLTKLIDRVRKDGFQVSDIHAIKEIKDEKLRMVDQFFGQTVYGVKFSEVFTQLDALDSDLNFALGIWRGDPLRGSIVGADEKLMLEFIERGKRHKQQLEAKLHTADKTPSGGGTTTTGTTTIGSGGATGGGTPNVVGTYDVSVVCDPASPCSGATFNHTWDITSENTSTGSFSGTGQNVSDGSSESITGTVSGNSMSATSTYQNGYVWYPTGTISSTCSITGTWTDNETPQKQFGTWSAEPVSGSCGH